MSDLIYHTPPDQAKNIKIRKSSHTLNQRYIGRAVYVAGNILDCVEC